MNQSADKLGRNPVYHGRTKHIKIRQHFIREVLNNYSVKLEYLPTGKMLADVLTKELLKKKHDCVRGLSLMD